MLNKVGSIHCGSCGNLLSLKESAAPPGPNQAELKTHLTPDSGDTLGPWNTAMGGSPFPQVVSDQPPPNPEVAAPAAGVPHGGVVDEEWLIGADMKDFEPESSPVPAQEPPEDEPSATQTMTLSRTMFGAGAPSAEEASPPQAPPVEEPVATEPPPGLPADGGSTTVMGMPAVMAAARAAGLDIEFGKASSKSPAPDNVDDMAPTLLSVPDQPATEPPADRPGRSQLLSMTQEGPPLPAVESKKKKEASKTLFGMKAAELGLNFLQETPAAVPEQNALVESDTAEFSAVIEEPVSAVLAPSGEMELDIQTPGRPDPFGLSTEPSGNQQAVEPVNPPAPNTAGDVHIEPVAPVGQGPGFYETEVIPVFKPEASPPAPQQDAGPAGQSYAIAGAELSGFGDPILKTEVTADPQAVPDYPAPPVPGTPSGGMIAARVPTMGVDIPVERSVAAFFQCVAGLAILASTFLPFGLSVWSTGEGSLLGAVLPVGLGLLAVGLTFPKSVPGWERFLLGLGCGALAVFSVINAGLAPFETGLPSSLGYGLLVAGCGFGFLAGLFGLMKSSRS